MKSRYAIYEHDKERDIYRYYQDYSSLKIARYVVLSAHTLRLIIVDRRAR